MKEKPSYFSVAFKEQSRPIFAYWALLLFSYLIFFVAILLTERVDGEDLLILMLIFGSSSIGCALGQLAALWRFREVIGIVHIVVFGFLSLLLISIGLPEEMAVALGMYSFLGSIMFFGGLWSLQAGRAIFAAWPPLIFAVGSIIIIINNSSDRLSTWMSGAKWMVWDATSLLGFVISIILLISYLVIRENLRIFRWRNGPRTTIASEDILETESKVRLSRKGWTSLVVFSIVLSFGVAFISPYMWQTGPGNRDSEEHYEENPEEVDCDNYSGCAPPPHCREREGESQTTSKKQVPPKQGSEEQIRQILEQAGNFLWILLWMIVLLILAYLIFGAPLRRILYVRHYRDPLWPVSTTKKIENQWDLIRIALADLGVQGSRGDSAVSLVEQAIPKLKEVTGSTRRVPGLRAAAHIRDRVVFGLGVGKEDAQKMNDNANWVYDSVWNRLGNINQIKALYRRKLW